MRELEFRIWDGEQMIHLPCSGLQYFDFEGSYSLGFTVDGYSEFWAHEQYKTATKEASKFPIMQFTGFLDKTGKKIFEGDLVKIPEDWDTYGFMAGETRQIIFKNGGFRFAPKDVKKGQGHWLESGVDLEIVGNIYENPEILKS